MIERVRALPTEIVRVSAPEVARALKADITLHIQQGQAPDGSAWQEKADGGRPLVGAQNDVEVEARGSVILARLTGKFVRHHKGTAKGGIRRQILPTRTIPASVVRACHEVFAKHFRRLMGHE